MLPNLIPFKILLLVISFLAHEQQFSLLAQSLAVLPEAGPSSKLLASASHPIQLALPTASDSKDNSPQSLAQKEVQQNVELEAGSSLPVAAAPKAPQTSGPSTVGNASARLLVRTAPYTISGGQDPKQHMKNIVFRLAVNHSNGSLPIVASNDAAYELYDASGLVGFSSASSSGARVNFNLARLLETLNNNNFTSEVQFPTNEMGPVNITISRDRGQAIDEALLEELLIDANLSLQDTNRLANGSQVVKDNHRFEVRQPARSKPPMYEASITPPPIRRTMDVVAENYTVRRVTEEANMFAIRLLHQLNVEKVGAHNLVQAPFAVYQGLALLLSGATGDTAKELDKTLLGSQSVYENTKLTHDQDRARLMESLGDVVGQIQRSSTHHLRTTKDEAGKVLQELDEEAYAGGTAQQHLIVANNLLFSPSAFEISSEFKNTLNSRYNNTALTRIETGSTESIQVVNGWIRRVTNGMIPSIMNKKQTFDEFNVMALLCSSWLAQEWQDHFYRIGSPLRTGVRLKGQGRSLGSYQFSGSDETLLEFVDDNRRSHFVEYMRSQPTENIHHFHSMLNSFWVDIVVVPFLNSNHRLIVLTPLATQNLVNQSSPSQLALNDDHLLGPQPLPPPSNTSEAPDSSMLSKLVSTMAANPRKALRSLWNTIAPEIITKKTLQHLQLARQKNITMDERPEVASSMAPLVQLSMPMIRTDADSSISPALNHLGIVNSFDPNQANFIGINGHPFNYYKLHLSNVISKTTFKMNERGINYDKTIKTLESLRLFPYKLRTGQTKFRPSQAEPELRNKGDLVDEVKLNKPFIYLVCDIKMRLVLYTGIMRNPSQED